jgi:hypothetical protein
MTESVFQKNNEGSQLDDLISFVEISKNGELSQDFPQVEAITFGRMEIPTIEENTLGFIDNQQVLFFGLSY